MQIFLQKGLLFISFFIVSTQVSAQTLQGECIKAGFGIDGYVYANGTEWVGAATAINGNNADDWFYDPTIYDGIGRNVIDTTDASYLRDLLANGSNVYFAKKMSVPPNSIINGRRWQDATYIKDYFGGSGGADSTSYITASKNGEPLEDWDTGIQNVVPKNDLIDCFAHLRRDGTAAENPLWIYLGFSRIATSGSSYFDAELFANEVSYDPATGFAPVGTDEGHTAWQFDAAGNITKIGDMIVTVVMNTSNIPEFELRIWVRRFDFNNVDPTTFTFGNDIDGASNGSQYGYADILPPMGNEFGCGVTNQKTWAGPPWGTLDDKGDHTFYYAPGQFVEIGLNLYDFGIDPQLITGFDACDLPFSNLIFKARASASFTAQLKDFSGPFYFVALDKLESNAVGDSLTCLNPIIPLSVDSVYTDAFYEWSTIDGNILTDMGSVFDTVIYVDQPGTYILASAFMNDCELSYDTILVNDYTQSPNVIIESDPINDCNNVIADLYASEAGHTYNWTGPNGGTFTGQFISVSDPGIYYLELTNEFGCVGFDSIYVLEFACQEVDPPTIQTTNIIDTLPPFFTVPPDISVECFDDILDLGITGNVTDEQDNCDPDIVEAIFTDEYDDTGFCIGTGQLNRIWSLTDDCGNFYTATQQIILIDTTPPVFTIPNDITITCEEDYMDLNLTGETPVAMDICDTTSVNVSFTDVVENDFSCNGQTRIQRIWLAIDDCGNTSLDTQIIIMADTIGPEIVGVQLIPFVACDSIPAPPTVTAVDNCDPNPTIVFTETTEAATCPNSYVLVRTWTATDNCGNETVITQEMNVEDAVNPVILVFPFDITVSCDDVPVPFEPEVADNCDSDIDIDFNEQQVGGTCEGDYTLIRSWTWVDDCDNEVTSSQTIVVQDITPPTFTIPVDITLSCVSDINDLNVTGDVIDETDNCTSNIGEAIFSDTANFDCVGSGVIERTWSLVDNCGNVTEEIQTISIIDTVPPVFDMPIDITINCDIDPLDLTITGNAINEFDDCDSTLGQVTYEDVIIVNPSCSAEQTINRSWSLSDDCGNVTIHLQVISIIDTIPPVFEMPTDVTIDCHLDNEDFTIVGEAVNAIDNCDENLGAITYQDTFNADDNCIGTGVMERVWSISDECGNTTSYTQTIDLIDTIPPVFTVPVDVSLSCEQDPNDLGLTGDVVDEFDNCFTALGEAIYSDSIIIDSPCEGSTLIYRTWTLEDGCGNITTYLQIISVEDTTPPVISIPDDITLDCFSELSDSAIVGVAEVISDNCSINFWGVSYIDSVLVNDSCNYSIQRAWLGTDACGNVAVDTQLIFIIDDVPPVFNTIPTDTIINCDVVPTAPTLIATDNCGGLVDIVFNENITAGSCTEDYTIIRTWEAADRCGNMFSFSQSIIVQDTIAPVISNTPADTIVACGALPNVVDPTVSDNCDTDVTMTFDENAVAGTCGGSSIVTRTWTWEDNCNNINTYVQTITLVDTIVPQFTTPNDITVNCLIDINDLNFTGNVIDESDNCDPLIGEAIYSDSLITEGLCNGNSTIYRTWILSDDCGNTMSDVQVISVIDTIPPSFTTPADVTLDCTEDPNDLIFSGGVMDESDLCASIIGEAIYTDSILVNTPCEGSSIIYRTWSLTDDCGNEIIGEQIITIIDTTPPVIAAPNDVGLNCFGELSDTSLIGEVLVVSEDCSSNTATATYIDNILQNDSCNYLIQRIWQVDDACGNTALDTQLISIIDTIAPVFNESLDTLIVGCDSIPPAPTLTAIDNCDSTVIVLFEETIVPGVCINNYTLVRTWTATDRCGNETIASQEIEVQDFAEPIILAFPPDMVVSCDSVPTVESQNVEDNCDVDITLDFQETIIEGSCLSDYIISRTWSWTDNCSNVSSHTQTITVIDNSAPIFTAPDDITVDCTIDINDLNFTGNVSGELDNCTDVIGNAIYQDSIFTEGICNGSLLVKRTWTLSDSCGNSSFDIQIIMVSDTLVPNFTVPENVIISCNQDPMDLNLTGDVTDESDLCDSSIGEATFTDSTFVDVICEGASVIYRTWILIDDCGNEFTAIQSIMVQDTQAPTFSLVPADTIVTCDSIPTVINPVVIDSCGSSFTVDFSEDNISVNCGNDFTIKRTWVATDNCGNQDSVIQLITVRDTVAPLLVIAPIDTTLNCEDLPAVPNLDFTDNCSDTVYVNFSETTTEGACIDIQIVTRTWVATDDCGNETTVTQQITLNHCSPEATVSLPVDTSLCVNESIDFEATLTGGYTNPVYQWQFTTDTTQTWNDISGATNSTFIISSIEFGDAGYYQVLISNDINDIYDTLCSVISDKVLLQVLPHAPPTNLLDEICDGDSVLFIAEYVTVAGQYVDTLVAANGCDSVVVLDLTVHPIYEMTIADTICFEDTYTHGDSTYNETGTYNYIFQTIEGCDSLVHLNLLVKEKILTERVEEMCDGDSVLFTTDYIFIAGQYADTLTAADGCDSIVNLDLTVHPIFELTIADTICFEDTYTHGDMTYNTSGSYDFVFQTIEGCDSLVHLDLFVKEKITTELVEEICDGDSLLFISNYVTIAGQYADTLVAADGCDSIVNLDLTVLPIYELTIADTICFEDTYTHGDSTFNETGTYDFIFQTIEGCDSLVHLNLLVKEKILTERVEEMCDGDSVLFTTDYIFIVGQYADTLIAADGCDSIVNLDLTVHPIFELTIADTICFEDTYTHGDMTYNTSGSYDFVFQTIEGCDSLVHLDLFVKEKISIELVEEICDGDSLLFITNYITIAGQYADTLVAEDGCDSIVSLELSILPVFEENHTATICAGEVFEFGDSTYTENGNYDFVFQSVESCDSLVHLELLVDPWIEENLNDEICQGDSILFNGQILNTTGQFTDTLTASNGCDSVVIMDLVVNPIFEIFHADTICAEEEYIFGDSTYSTTGTYEFIFQTTNGCDSLVHLNLLVNQPIDSLLNEQICQGDSIFFAGSHINLAGNYIDSLTASNGCDSIVTLNLIVDPIYEELLNHSMCIGDSLVFGTNTYFETGTHDFTFQTINGCDSLVHLDLVVNEVILTPFEDSICEGDSILFQGGFFNQTGFYTDTLISTSGCDSVVTMDLIVYPVYEINHSDTICNGEDYIFGNDIYTVSGSHTFTFQTVNGCDSIVHLDLLVTDPIVTNLNNVICDGDTLLFANQSILNAGQYTDTLIAANGCDSLVVLDLIVYPVYEESFAQTICIGDSIVFGDNTYFETGTYDFTFQTVSGCDSLVHLDLVVNDVILTPFENSICEGDSIFFQGGFLNQTGFYTDTLLSASGCDSVVTMDLIVYPIYEISHSDTICNGEDYVFGNDTYTVSGSHTFTFQTGNGCDSIVHLDLLVTDPIVTNLIDGICDGDTLLFANQNLVTAGQYTDTLIAANGCDSVVVLDLIVHPIYEEFFAQTICIGDSIVFGDTTYFETGTHDFTFQTVDGCDSLVHLDLVVNTVILNPSEASICEGDSILFQSEYLNQTGFYTDILLSASGCDSVVTMDLIVHPIYEINHADTICYGEDYVFGIDTYTVSGSHTFTFQTVNGCDSIVHLNLLVNDPIITNLANNICEGDTVLFAGQNLVQTGVFTDSLIAINGCDSIVIFNLSVHLNYVETQIINLCEGTPYEGIIYPSDTILIDSLQSVWSCDSILVTEILIRNEIIDSTEIILCLGELYQGIAYATDTTLTFNGISVNGCDSTFNTFVKVNLPSDTLIQSEICEGDELVVGNQTYTTTGSYVQTISAVNGCDSTINVNLIVWEDYENLIVNILCNGDSLNGNVYFSNTILVDSLQNIHGCDSIEINQIIVYQPSEEINNIQLCEGIPYQGIVYANDTTLIDSLQNFVGCDSIIINEISIVQDIRDSISQSICYGEIWNGNLYFADTIFINNYTSVGGCDSLVTTTLEVLPLAHDTLYFEICEGENITAGGATQTQSGTYYDNYTAANGCDSSVVSFLTVYPNYLATSIIEICQGDSAMIFGNYEMTAGDYFENNISINGCDSIISITLDVTDPQMSSQVLYLCEGDSILIGGEMQITGGEFIDTLSNIVGCDSLVTTTLVIVPDIIIEYSLDICEEDGWQLGDSTYYVSGIYTDTLISSFGCDSIVIVQLDVHPIYEFTQDVEICEGEQFFAGGANQTISGTYTDNYSTINGCDSIWITNLIVYPKSTTALAFSFCEGESYFAGGVDQTTSGVYSDMYQNIYGCDSIVTTTLTFYPLYNYNQLYTICENDSIFLAGNFQNMSGIFIDSLTSINGCDSIISSILTISEEQVEFLFEKTICLGDSIYIANEWQFTSGTFVETFNPTNGCDSIVTTVLNVLSPNYAIWEDAEICYGDEVQLFLESTGEIENITWNPSFSLSCDDCPNPVAFPDETTTYTVTYPSGCDEKILETEVTVVVNELAEVEVVQEEITIIQGDTIILMVAEADSNFTYIWTDGSGNMICDSCTSITVYPNTSTNYTVTAYDPNNPCPGKANTIVFVNNATCADGKLEVSNVIFPQSGGYGDHLEIQYDRVEINVLRIYNRWGELVFETTDIDNKWDGTFRGELLNPGVYVYYILGVCPDEKRTKFMYSGNVTLIH